ncbi:MAG: putative monovalent cation/H+ antiporter subunit B [Euryarchaeota archaeon ADurb.BinA087]|nr:MAG: putative monovalent cation/H+ antiporter subunit B [Euryarchaeota archaeon ADurb.BinA087]HNQ25175.1 MnhB domain-containing protein [Methanoregulaceae archaeon]HQA80917.1 MnhB domain-containing protein [Methanoregulaceae archaeon]
MRMSKIVRFGADVLFGAIVIFGLYIIMHGHLTPGGGFQGGAVVATGVALVIVAYSYEEVIGMVKKFVLTIQESAGLVMFAGVALIAIGLGTTFFFNFLANSGSLFGMTVPFGPNSGELNTGGVLPLMNIAVGIEVWGGLAIIILYMLSGIGKTEEA